MPRANVARPHARKRGKPPRRRARVRRAGNRHRRSLLSGYFRKIRELPAAAMRLLPPVLRAARWATASLRTLLHRSHEVIRRGWAALRIASPRVTRALLAALVLIWRLARDSVLGIVQMLRLLFSHASFAAAGRMRTGLARPGRRRAAATAFGLAAGLGLAVFVILLIPPPTPDVTIPVDMTEPTAQPDPQLAEKAVATFKRLPPDKDPVAALPPLTAPEDGVVPGAEPSGEPETRIARAPARPARPPRPGANLPPWLAHAVYSPAADGRPMIAVVIDDVGIDQVRTARTIDLPAPLTLAFIPYGFNLDRHTGRARERGHELLVHIPMEPTVEAADPGPNALLTGLQSDEIMRRFQWGLGRMEGYVGVSNHMGSKFMARADLLEPLLAEIRGRGLLFLDSRTAIDTTGARLAHRMGIPNIQRDVFLDNELTADDVLARLAQLESIARKRGYAVGIGHPHDVTIDTLADWIPKARERGFLLAPLSALVRRGIDERQRLATAGEANGLLGGAQ